METTLKFGHFCNIRGSYKPGENQDGVSGFLSARGYTDTSVSLQTLPIDISDKAPGIAVVQNYRDMIFQVWPKLNYEAHKEFVKQQKTYNILKRKGDEELEANPGDKEFLERTEARMENLKKRMVEEKDSNDKLLLSHLGMDVTYGAEIQFYHVDSKMFLTGRVLCSESDKSAYKFELSSSFGTGMIFKFVPRYKLRQEGEVIQFKDQLLIFNIKLNCYANFSISDPLEIDQSPPKENHKPTYYRHPLRSLDQESKRYEAFLSTAPDTTWQFLYHGKYEPEAWGRIRGGDLIRLRHTESSGELTADYLYRNSSTECYIRKYGGDYDEEESSINSIWEVEKNENENRGDEILIQKNTESKDSIYKLRHFLSGRLLSLGKGVLKSEDGHKELPILIEEKEVKGKSHVESSIHFISTVADDRNTVDNNACYKIKVKDRYLYVDTNVHFSRDDIKSEVGAKISGRESSNAAGKTLSNFDFSTTDEDFFIPLKDEEFDEKRSGIYCEELPSDENAFSVFKVSDEEKADLLFVSSTYPIIQRFVMVLRSGDIKGLSPDIIRKTSQVLQSLIFFVIKTDKEDPIECEGISLPKRQKIMKDMKIIEFLTEILHLPFKNKWFDIKDLSKADLELIKILKMSYRLVKHIIREYRPNELYASQWLDLFMKQAMLTTEESDILAEATLTELVDNNRRLLESKIKNSTIESFVDLLLRQDLNDKYVNLLRALVTCDGEPMINNQAELSRMLFNSKEVIEKLILPLREDGGTVEIFVKKKWIALGDFQDADDDKDKKILFDYFISFTNLLADLCLSRNYLAINPIESRLIINLWIDRSPFMKIILPNKIRVWTELEDDQNKIISTDKDTGSFDKLKTYVCEYLNKICKDGYQKAYDTSRNRLTEAILRLTNNMLEFGFYKVAPDINELLRPLLKLLNGTRDITTKTEESRYQQDSKPGSSPLTKKKSIAFKKQESKQRLTSRYEETEDNITLHRSKEVICRILETILKIRDDKRVTNILINFKKQVENETDLHQNSLIRVGGSINKSKKGIYKLLGTEEKEEDLVDPLAWMKRSIETKDLNVDVENGNIVAVLLDLILYERPDLVNMSFSVINQKFSQYQTMLGMLNEVQIIADNKSIADFKDLQELQFKLSTCAERTENWMGVDKPDANAEAESTITIIEKLSTNLTFTAEEDPARRVSNIVEEPDVEDIPHGNQSDSRDFTYDGSILRPNEFPNAIFQRMIRNLGIYNLVISILKFDVDSFTEKRTSGQLKITLDTHFRVLRSCYKMLAKFIHTNSENQKLLEDSIDIFFKHMTTLPSVGCNLIIDALFRNNRTLLYDTVLFPDRIRMVVDTVEKLKIENPTKSSYLECMKIMTKYRDRIIKNNQTILTTEICNRDHQNVLLTFSERDTQANLKKAVEEFNSNVNSSQKGPVFVPNIISYLNSLLHLLSITCEEKNNATESKCQSFFPLDHLITLMNLSDRCWYIRKAILFFYFHVYLDTEREMNEEQKEVDILTKMIESDIEILSESFASGNNNLEIKNFKGSFTLKGQKQDYYINGLLPCVVIILKKRLLKEEAERKNFVQILLDSIAKISKLLDPKNTVDKRTFANFIQFLGSQGLVKNEILRQKIDKEFLIPATSGGNVPQKTIVPSVTLSLGNKLKQQDDFTRESRLRSLFENLEKNPLFLESVEKEFKELVNFVIDIEHKTEYIFDGGATIAFEELAKKFMILMDATKSSLDMKLITIGLKLFRKIIEMENRENTNPAADWETDDYAESKTNIVKRQNQLVNIGLVTLLKNTVASQKSSKEVKEEAVLVSISLLLGGNINAQNAFYKELSKDKNNDFLVALRDMVNISFENVKKMMNHQNKRILDSMLSKTRVELKLTDEIEEESPTKVHAMIGGINEQNFTVPPQNIEMASVKQDPEADQEKPAQQNSLDEEEEFELNYLKRLYRLLQLFCEGHNLQLQNHLREQRIEGVQSGRSFDFINLTALILSQFIKFVNVHCVPLGDQILDFLIESVQGPCRENQLGLCRSKIIDISKDFLAKFQRQGDYERGGFITNPQQDAINNLMTKSNTLLVSLIEGVTNREIIVMLCDNLDLNFLLNRLKNAYLELISDLSDAGKTNKKLMKLQSMVSIFNLDDNRLSWVNEKLGMHFQEDITEAFYLYILLRNLAHENEKIASVIKSSADKDTEEALSFFNYHTASIELLFNGKLVRLYFPIQPICRYLSKNSRSTLMMTVSRDSPNDKIMGLVSAAPQMFDEMEHLAYLKTTPISITAKRLNKIRDLSTILAFFINFWIIYAYSIVLMDSNRKAGVENQDILPVQTIIDISGYIQIGTSCLMLLMWLIINSPLILKNKWREQVKINRFQFTQNKNISEEDKQNLDDIGIDVNACTLEETRKLLRLRGPEDTIFHKKKNTLNFGNMFTKLEYYWLSLTYLFSESSFNYMIFYIIISIMGSVISEICYALHLFDIINRFQTLKNVIKSVTYNALQLGLTLVFGLTLLYIYAMLAFYFFDDNFFIGSENTCTTLFQCYLTIINQGLRNGGGIGDVLMPMSYKNENIDRYFVRFFYDLLFFASINIVFLNIIFGIIVDTFAELREKKNKMDEDMKNICYICNLDRYTFDRNADGFESHIDRDHCLWNYVYFMYHLKNKDVTDYNGIESFVSEKLKQDDNSWFPLLKAMTIAEDEEADVEQIVNQEVNRMDEKLSLLRAKVDEITMSKEI